MKYIHLTLAILAVALLGSLVAVVHQKDTSLVVEGDHSTIQVDVPKSELKLGAPSEFFINTATSTDRGLTFAIGTSTGATKFGSTTLMTYGSTTLQQWDSGIAFRILDAATSSVLSVNTLTGTTTLTGLRITGTGVPSCSEIETDADGDIFCGTDDGAASVVPNVILTDDLSTLYLAASTSAQAWLFQQGFVTNASSTVNNVLTVGGAFSASSTGVFAGGLQVDNLSSALIVTDANGLMSDYGGIDCTDQFVRDVGADGAGTCATVTGSDVDLEDLTATNGSLTFTGAYDGQTARTVGVNLAHDFVWTGNNSFAGTSIFTGAIDASTTAAFDTVTVDDLASNGAVYADSGGTLKMWDTGFSFSFSSSTLSTTTQVFSFQLPNAVTLTEISCNTTLYGTSSIQISEATRLEPSSLTPVIGDGTALPIECGSGFVNATTSFQNAGIADGVPNWFVISDAEPTGEIPVTINVSGTFTIDD